MSSESGLVVIVAAKLTLSNDCSARSMPNGTIWVPASQAMNGFAAMPSPYSPPAVRTSLPSAYPGVGKYAGSSAGQAGGTRYGGSQQYRSPSSGGRMDGASPTSYVYASAGPTQGGSPHIAQAHYAQQARGQAFSPPGAYASHQQSGYHQQQQPYRGNAAPGSRFSMRSPSAFQQQQQPLW